MPPKRRRAGAGAGAGGGSGGSKPGGQVWLVCVNAEDGADAAFEWTVRSMSSADSLVILTIVELVASNALSQLEDFVAAQIRFNDELEKHAAVLVGEYKKRAEAAGVTTVNTAVVRSRDVRHAVLNFVNTSSVPVDNLVVARRSMLEVDTADEEAAEATEDRVATAIGSVSDFLVRHAPCNVVVVK